jgi:hypothetical protein
LFGLYIRVQHRPIVGRPDECEQPCQVLEALRAQSFQKCEPRGLATGWFTKDHGGSCEEQVFHLRPRRGPIG